MSLPTSKSTYSIQETLTSEKRVKEQSDLSPFIS